MNGRRTRMMWTARLLALLVLAGAASASAQARAAVASSAATRASSRGVAVQAPPPAQTSRAPRYDGRRGGYVVTTATYFVMPDGSMIVYYGPVYQRTVRSCVKSPTQTDTWGRDPLGHIPDPPGIAALNAGERGAVSGHLPASNVSACYRADRQHVWLTPAQ